MDLRWGDEDSGCSARLVRYGGVRRVRWRGKAFHRSIAHLKSCRRNVEAAARVLRCYQRDIARFIHSQMQEHFWEEASGYETKITKGFTELKPAAYTAAVNELPMDSHAHGEEPVVFP